MFRLRCRSRSAGHYVRFALSVSSNEKFYQILDQALFHELCDNCKASAQAFTLTI